MLEHVPQEGVTGWFRRMRTMIQGMGVLLTLMGVGGTIDHLWTQPIMGIVLNVFRRLVVSGVSGFGENAIPANPGPAVCGVVLIVVTEAFPRARDDA